MLFIYAIIILMALIQSRDISESIITFDFSGVVNIGDIVRPDSDNDNSVLSCTDNKHILQAIGVVVSIESGTCRVMKSGLSDIIYIGISRGDRIFLNDSGSVRSGIPDDGYIQEIGYSPEDTKIFFDFDSRRVKSSPF